MPSPSRTLPEDICYNHAGIPLHLYAGHYPSDDGRRQCLAHWHDEFEVIAVRRGRMRWRIDGRSFVVGPGEVVFVNSGRIHDCGQADEDGCEYDCALFSPLLVGASSGLRERFVDPVLRRDGFDAAVLRGDAAEAAARTLREVVVAEEARGELVALQAAGMVFRLWAGLFPALRETEAFQNAGVRNGAGRGRNEADIARAMAAHVRERFAERLTLAGIAAAKAGGVCRSRCCAIFRRHLAQSPIDYLTSYRLAVAERLLRHEPGRTVADIAAACGFAHQSYFTQQFRAQHGLPPDRWRRNCKE